MRAFLGQCLLFFGKLSSGKSSECYCAIAMVTCLSSKMPFGGKKLTDGALSENFLEDMLAGPHVHEISLCKELPVSSDLLAFL